MNRPRGRPRKSDDQGTRERLIQAATDACVEVGFEAVTLSSVARRADVTPAAVYNHFADKAALLYAAGRSAIEQLGARAVAAGALSTLPGGHASQGARPRSDARRRAHDVVDAFTDASFDRSRRLIVELHLAGRRHPELEARLAEWHREFASFTATDDQAEGARLAEVKALFVLLLGACHLDDLGAIHVDGPTLSECLHRMIDGLYGVGSVRGSQP